MIKVSILMPVYNSEKYLREAIDSILNQTFTDFEFIIINDGSKDKTTEIIQSYSDDRIVLVNNENNLGIVKSLNKGLSIAQGEYTARMDGDDISLPERLEKQVAFLDEYPCVVLLGSAYHVIDESGQIIKTVIHPTSHEEISIRLLFNNCFAHSSVMFRTSAVKQIGGYDVDFIYAEDYYLWWRLAQIGKVNNYPEVLHLYRRNPGGIFSTKILEHNYYAERVSSMAIQKFIDQKSNLGLSYTHVQKYLGYSSQKDVKQYIRRHLANLYFNIGWTEFNNEDMKSSRSHFLYSLRYGRLILKTPFLILLTFIHSKQIKRMLRQRLRQIEKICNSFKQFIGQNIFG